MTKKRLKGYYDNMDDMRYSKTDKILNSLDPDLKEYFSDMRLIKGKKSKTKTKKASFSIGDNVEVNDDYGTIIYGPYTSDGKDTYEIELESGEIITAKDDGNAIKSYVPPVEEKEDDDLL